MSNDSELPIQNQAVVRNSARLPIPMQTVKRAAFSLGIAMFLIGAGFFAYTLLYKQSENYLIVSDQVLSGAIRIKEARLKEGGFIMVRPVGKYPAFAHVAMSEYLPAGIYKNVGIPYSQLLMGEDLQGSGNRFEAGVYLSEQRDDISVGSFGKPARDIFRREVKKLFSMTEAPVRIMECTDGFFDDFSGPEIDSSYWQWTHGASLMNGAFVLETPDRIEVNAFIPHEFQGPFRQSINIMSFDPVYLPDDPNGAEMTFSFASNTVGFGWRWHIEADGPRIQAFVSAGGETNTGESVPVTPEFPKTVEIIRNGSYGSIQILGAEPIVLWEGELPQENVITTLGVVSPSQRHQYIRAALDAFTFSCP